MTNLNHHSGAFRGAGKSLSGHAVAPLFGLYAILAASSVLSRSESTTIARGYAAPRAFPNRQ